VRTAAGGTHAANANEEATKRHFASLVAPGKEPKLAELTMFFTMMPKGGDLHHHYSGAIYAEQYLEWVDKEGFCVNKATYTIEKNKPAGACVSGQDVMNDNTLLANLLQRWSDKDFYNHSAIQSPPDRQFFDTFRLLWPGVVDQHRRWPAAPEAARHPGKPELHRNHLRDRADRAGCGL
jgi:adenosine deaminase/adenosine deaminase CECR1